MSAKTAPRPAPALNPADAALMNYLGTLFGGADAGTGARVKQAETAVAGATRQGSDAIAQLTDRYAGRLASVAPQMRADYGSEEANRATETGALAGFLKGEGGASYDDVAAKLRAINAPGDEAARVGSLGQGIAGQAAAHGDTELGRLGAEKAAQVGLADTLPALGAMQGRGQLNEFLAGQRKDLGDRVSAIEDKGADLKSTRAQTLASFLGNQLDRKTQLAIAKLGFQTDKAKLASGDLQAAGFTVDPTTGNIVPTVDNPNYPGGKNDQGHADAHAKAVKARGAATQAASSAVRTLVSGALKQQYDVETKPVVLREGADGKPIYAAAGGGFTRDPAQAKQQTVKTPKPVPGYNDLYQRALQLQEVAILGSRYGLKPAQVQALVAKALAAMGVAYKPQPKPKPGSLGPGRKPGEPPH